MDAMNETTMVAHPSAFEELDEIVMDAALHADNYQGHRLLRRKPFGYELIKASTRQLIEDINGFFEAMQ